MKLIVFGSSGGAGREVLKQALERNQQVTAIDRDPDKPGDLKTKHLVEGRSLQ